MTVTSAFLGMMAYYYTTGVAVIHPYLIIVGVLGSLSLVATSVVDIFEHNK
jgi:Na+/proline symporter